MLEFLRQNVGGVLGLAIIGALVFVFALSFGAQSAGWGQGQTVQIAAEVFGTAINQADYDYAVNMAGGRELDRKSPEYALVGQQVLAGLVERQLLLEYAGQAGISASRDEAEQSIVENRFLLSVAIEDLAKRVQRSFFLDEATAARILLEDGYRVRQSFLKEDNAFDLTAFQNWVRYSLQLTEDRFVEQQRLELIAARVRKLLVSGVRVSEREVRDAYERESDTVSIKYLRLSPDEFSARLEPSAEELQAWTEVNREAVSQHYETNKFRYTNLEKQVRARHILLKVAETATDEERAARRTEMEGIVARIQAGEDFAALARQLSEDGSAPQGGDLDWSPRGRMVPEFDDAMFALEPGRVSGVVETKYGFHVIKSEGVREGNVTLEEATPEIAAKLYRTAEGKRLATEAAQGYLARLQKGIDLDGLLTGADRAAVAPDEAPAAAVAPDEAPAAAVAPDEAPAAAVAPDEAPAAATAPDPQLKVRTSPPFGRDASSIPGIGSSTEIVSAAFELTPDRPVAPRAFDVQGDLLIVQLAERSVPNDEGFAEQQDALSGKLLALKQASWLRDRVRDLTAEARQRGQIVANLPEAEPQRPERSPVGPAADLPAGPAGKAAGAEPVDVRPVEAPAKSGADDDGERRDNEEDGE
jgi:peptidyl-prolyl cis-trans isomerase D